MPNYLPKPAYIASKLLADAAFAGAVLEHWRIEIIGALKPLGH